MLELTIGLVLGCLIFVGLMFSVFRKKKDSLEIQTTSTWLQSNDTLQGQLQLLLEKESDTEELSVTLMCVEVIKHRKDGVDATSNKIIFENKNTLIGRTTYHAGHEEIIPFEIAIPNSIKTQSLDDYYEPVSSSMIQGNDQDNKPRSLTNCSLAQMCIDNRDSVKQPIQPIQPSSELRWQLCAVLKSKDQVLHDTQPLNIKMASLETSSKLFFY